jgi:hypothetical protein
MRHLFTLVILVLSLAACSGPEAVYKAEIETVDSLLLAVDKYQARYGLLNVAAIEEEIVNIEAINKILHGPQVDQNDRNYWTVALSPFELVIRPYQKFLGDKFKIEKNLSYSKKQLLSLRKSLVDEVVDTAKVKSYLLDESNAVRELYLLSMKRIEPTIKAQAIWDSTQSKFQAMADSISGLPINQ